MTYVAWTDKSGVKHAVINAEAVLADFYERWPDGLDEIEAAVSGWRRRAMWLEAKLANIRMICATQMAGITDVNTSEAFQDVIDTVDREFDYLTGK